MRGRWAIAFVAVAALGSGIGVSVEAAGSEAEWAAARQPPAAPATVAERSPATGLPDGAKVDQEPPVPTHLKWLGSDALVTNPAIDQVEPSIAAAPDGRLFAAVDEAGNGRILIYQSTDTGTTWSWLTSFVHGSLTRNPSLVYAENGSQKWLVVAYELVISSAERSLYAVRIDPDDTTNYLWSDIHINIPWANASTELHPQITTDFPDFTSGIYFYVTYALPSIDYYPVYFARSTDQGVTWSTPENITGGSENTAFESKPEIAYCANNKDLYVAFNKPGWTGSTWTQQIWVTSSGSFGATGSWGTPVQVTSSSRIDYHPSIAAAWDADTVVVGFTSEYGAADNDVQTSYSTDGGTTWSSPISMPGWTFDREDNLDLAASHRAGGRFHVAYRKDEPDPDGGHVWYSWAGFATPIVWSSPVDVDDGSQVSGHDFYPRPGIGVNPALPPAYEAAIGWTKYGGPSYDVYFDGPGASLIFADDFESSNLSAWSLSAP